MLAHSKPLKRSLLLLISTLTILLPFSLAAQIRVLSDEYIVQRHEGIPVAAQPLHTAYSIKSRSLFIDVVRPASAGRLAQSESAVSRIVPFNAARAAADCAAIMQDPTVKSCEPNFVRSYDDSFPNDPLFYPSFNHPGQVCHYANFADGISSFDIRSPFAWDFSVGSDSVVIGIVDSGINYNHPDLAPNLWNNPNEIFNGVDDDGNGYIDDIIGVDANTGGSDPFDCNGHGSHVAGIIGARGNNGIGIAGVAWRVKMAIARNAIDCSDAVSVAAAVRGIEYFYDLKKNRGINIVAINASYSGDGFSPAERNAIDRLRDVNIVFVAAAGNNGINIDSQPRYPAAHDLDNIISVANVDNSVAPNTLASNSNFGVVGVDIGAPGTNIFSTIEPGQFNAENYGIKSGTSMAAPAVVGAIATLAAQRPYFINYRTIINHVFQTIRPVAILNGQVKTGGMLHLFNLLTAADPADACPNDPNKIEPGFCGCGNPENYADGDNDRTPNCADQCPNDPGKSAPGACGCGTADGDFNANAFPDCQDASIAGESPAAPIVTVKNRKLNIQLAAVRPGAQYLVEIFARPRGKSKFKRTVVRTGAALLVRALPAKGTALKINYFFTIPGPTTFTSQSSPVVRKSIR